MDFTYKNIKQLKLTKKKYVLITQFNKTSPWPSSKNFYHATIILLELPSRHSSTKKTINIDQ